LETPEFETFKVMGPDEKPVEVKGQILARERKPQPVPPQTPPEPAAQ